MSYTVNINSGGNSVSDFSRIGTRSRGAAIALALFMGGIGVHRFYLNRPISGVLYLMFCWTFIPAVFALIEIIVLLCSNDYSFDHKYNFARNMG